MRDWQYKYVGKVDILIHTKYEFKFEIYYVDFKTIYQGSFTNIVKRIIANNLFH